MRRALVGLAFLALSCVSVLSEVAGAGRSHAADPPSTVPGAQEVWRVMNKCPVTSLYIVLRLHKRPVSYRDIEERLPVGPEGSNLAQMRECAASFGLHGRVVKSSLAGLSWCPLPALAHCDEEKDTGHYVVVLSVRGDEVEVIDGTSAMFQTLSMSEFGKRWSGYLIVFQQSAWWRPFLPVPVGLGLTGLCLLAWRRWRNHRALRAASAGPQRSPLPFPRCNGESP